MLSASFRLLVGPGTGVPVSGWLSAGDSALPVEAACIPRSLVPSIFKPV